MILFMHERNTVFQIVRETLVLLKHFLAFLEKQKSPRGLQETELCSSEGDHLTKLLIVYADSLNCGIYYYFVYGNF